MNFPGQAVILCGGLGTRLVHIRFLSLSLWLILMANLSYITAETAFRNWYNSICSSLGYKSNEIINYFGNGCE